MVTLHKTEAHGPESFEEPVQMFCTAHFITTNFGTKIRPIS